MSARIIGEFLKVVKGELAKYPNQYSVGALFLWGVSISLFSVNLGGMLLAILYLLIAHALAVITLYIGFAKDVKNKRTPLAIFLGLIILFLTLSIDTLFTVSF
jgi:hypothetical protein